MNRIGAAKGLFRLWLALTAIYTPTFLVLSYPNGLSSFGSFKAPLMREIDRDVYREKTGLDWSVECKKLPFITYRTDMFGISESVTHSPCDYGPGYWMPQDYEFFAYEVLFYLKYSIYAFSHYFKKFGITNIFFLVLPIIVLLFGRWVFIGFQGYDDGN